MAKPNLLFLLIFCIQTTVLAQQKPLGYAWAQNMVNGVVLRKNSVVSYNNTQYTAWYNQHGKVVLAKRQLGTKAWTLQETQYSGNTKDAHCSISIMLDGDGYLHMAWDHHGNPLNYCKSVTPGSLELDEKIGMIGKSEKRVTYPEFYRLPNGDLIFFYRDGSSGNGTLVLNRYHLKTKKWSRVQDVLIDGEGQRNAYWQACVDVRGTIHLSWVWRETSDVATNHDLCYARSEDFGMSWQRLNGEKYSMPITMKNAEYAAYIPQKSDLINQTSMFADSDGYPYIATYFTPKRGKTPQYHVVYADSLGWKIRQVTQREKPFSLSGGGTKKLDLSRPQIIVDDSEKQKKVLLLYRDVERGNKASMSWSTNADLSEWQATDITDFSLGDWEPSFDTELWKSDRKLHLFVQKMGQGDGETLEKMEPQTVYVWEVELNK